MEPRATQAQDIANVISGRKDFLLGISLDSESLYKFGAVLILVILIAAVVFVAVRK